MGRFGPKGYYPSSRWGKALIVVFVAAIWVVLAVVLIVKVL